MADHKLSIFHFDDELDVVDWIPDLLRNHYRLRHPGWLRPAAPSTGGGNGSLHTFRLVGPGGSLEITYRGYVASDVQEFRQLFTPDDSDILILDLFHESRDGLRDVGSKFYHDARRSLDESRIYVLTGYPNNAQTLLTNTGLAAENLFAKPPNVAAFIDSLARKIDPFLPQK